MFLLSSLSLLSGDVLEIQAASNNTIKGGLTGDPTDRQALVDIVTAGVAWNSAFYPLHYWVHADDPLTGRHWWTS
jgi:hypothetical protein